MKQSLSLRVSQHLALTPQLQQSIRLLQLSTLELNQEVEQMLDENPFLEVGDEAAPREEFGQDGMAAGSTGSTSAASEESTTAAESAADTGDDYTSSETETLSDWDGDGSIDMAADDSEWGGDAPALSLIHI